MSLFTGPEEHAANPPETWQPVKAGTRRWQLRTTSGGVLGNYVSRTHADAAKTSGFLVDLYDKERRWYAGEPVPGWKPYQPRQTSPAAPALTDTPTPSPAPTVKNGLVAMRTVADFKRAATPGSRWLCINYLNPNVSGPRTITGGKTKLKYEGVKADGTVITNGGLEFPKANGCRIDGDTVTFLEEAGSDLVAFTWTRLPNHLPAESARLPRFIPARPWRRELRGTADKPWCVYDTERIRVAPMASPDAGDGDGAYFATEGEAQAWIIQHSVDQAAPVVEPAAGQYAAVWSRPITPGAGRLIGRPTRAVFRTEPVTVLGPVDFEPSMLRVRTEGGRVARAMRDHITPADQEPTQTEPLDPWSALLAEVA